MKRELKLLYLCDGWGGSTKPKFLVTFLPRGGQALHVSEELEHCRVTVAKEPKHALSEELITQEQGKANTNFLKFNIIPKNRGRRILTF